MGLYDRLTFEDGLDVDAPDPEIDLTGVAWQTKSIRRPMLENYKVTMDGRLFRQVTRTESVPEEERPLYDEERGGFESEFEKCCGMFRTIPEGWTDTEHHGIVEFHRSIDGEYVSFEAKFTDGGLVAIRENERRAIE